MLEAELDLDNIIRQRDKVNQLVKLSDTSIKNNEITDSIIENIKLIEYKTLTLQQSKTLTEVVKETLRQVRQLTEDKELALIYDLNGYKNQYGEWLFKETGKSNTDYISLGSNSDVFHIINLNPLERAIVISHNHPNNRIISLLDLQAIIEIDTIKIIVAVTNSGKISYIVKDNFSYEEVKQLLKSITDNIKFTGNQDEYMDTVLVTFLAQCEKYGLYFYKES